MTKLAQYTQWLNENEERAYPVRETATRVATDGSALPDDLIVDLGLLVTPEHSDIYFTSVRVSPQAIIVALASPASGLLIGTFRVADVVPYTAYRLTSMLPDVEGWIAFGNYRAAVIEDYRFSGPEASGVELRALRTVDPLPVKKFVKFGGSPDYFADKVTEFRGNGGLVFELDPDDPDGKTILVRLDGEHKFNFAGPCNDQAEHDVCGVPPMRSFNGVCPDESGKITLRFE